MRLSRLYCWPSLVAWQAALAAEGWDQGAPPGVDLLISQDLLEPSEDPEQLGAPIAGVFVAGVFRDVAPAAWEPMRIEEASAPAAMLRWPPQPVPASVSRFQARAALAVAGLLPQVEAAVAAGPELARIAWQDAAVFERASPTLGAIAAQLGLTGEEMDDLFRAAAEIVA